MYGGNGGLGCLPSTHVTLYVVTASAQGRWVLTIDSTDTQCWPWEHVAVSVSQRQGPTREKSCLKHGLAGADTSLPRPYFKRAAQRRSGSASWPVLHRQARLTSAALARAPAPAPRADGSFAHTCRHQYICKMKLFNIKQKTSEALRRVKYPPQKQCNSLHTTKTHKTNNEWSHENKYIHK